MKKEKQSNLNTYLIIALVIVVAIGMYFTLSVPKTEKETVEQATPPTEIQLTILGSDCEECYDLKTAIGFIKEQENINVTDTSEKTIEESQELIEKYNISRLPALIITGNITNMTIPNLDKKEDALIFDEIPAPYYDVATKKIIGRISVIALEDPTCTKCFNSSIIIEQLKSVGVSIVSEKTIDVSSEEGKELIQKYKIEKIPTLLFNKEALEYEIVKQVWEQVGTEESDGTLVVRLVNPPYKNMSTNKTEGLIVMSLLYDKTCNECFNASIYREVIVQSFGLYVEKEELLDINSTKGKFMVKKYNITAIPTVVLSKEAAAYPALAQSWEQVGTAEKDGSFVFKNVTLLETYFEEQGEKFAYKDLSIGEVVTATEEEPEITQPENETES